MNEFLAKETLINKNFNLNYENCKNILFTEGIRKQNFWLEKLHPLKVSNKDNFKENFISFKQSSKLTNDELQWYKNFLYQNRVNKVNVKNKDFYFNSLFNYFSNFLNKIIIKRFKNITDFCNEKFDFDKFENLIIPASPLFEIIPILNEMKIKNKNIYLIPHSSTPSFEYHPDSYKKQITFISSKNLMPSSKWHKENSQKELIVSNNFFETKFKRKEKVANYFTEIKKYNIFTNFKLIIDKIFLLIINKFRYLNQIYFFKFFSKSINNVGLVLNVEIYENLVDIDFNKQNDLIIDLFNFCLKKNLNLIIRRKPGWTNYFFLKKKLSQNFLKKELKKLFLLHDKFSINDGFKNVKIYIFSRNYCNLRVYKKWYTLCAIDC